MKVVRIGKKVKLERRDLNAWNFPCTQKKVHASNIKYTTVFNEFVWYLKKLSRQIDSTPITLVA